MRENEKDKEYEMSKRGKMIAIVRMGLKKAPKVTGGMIVEKMRPMSLAAMYCVGAGYCGKHHNEEFHYNFHQEHDAENVELPQKLRNKLSENNDEEQKEAYYKPKKQMDNTILGKVFSKVKSVVGMVKEVEEKQEIDNAWMVMTDSTKEEMSKRGCCGKCIIGSMKYI